ncbi:MAG: 3-dehydroquinate synthase [Bacteroidaceae bacterium]|nr:3-dehydroquinate synthase [Bacteroidaceae bacterium]
MSKQKVIICQDLRKDLYSAIQECPHDRLFILVDEHIRELCLPLISGFGYLNDANIITIGAEDVHKNVETLVHVWQSLGDGGASRHSLMINLGGGMVTDLGGFAASTFKRGIKYINIPTTLLAMVDASVGGKTGINFNGLKNEIGVFSPAEYVLIDTEFLKSLDTRNLLSGYAEMLKHGIISTTGHWAELLNFNMTNIDYKALQALVAKSVQIKEGIVAEDPFEKGIRKALNLGHTAGHAFESLALETNRPVFHGYAVAWGIVCELYFSHLRTGFPKDKLRQTVQFIKDHYGIFTFDCKQYDRLYQFMTHDKKNNAGIINFTLMGEIGDIRINQSANQEEIFEMLDFYRETMGC